MRKKIRRMNYRSIWLLFLLTLIAIRQCRQNINTHSIAGSQRCVGVELALEEFLDNKTIKSKSYQPFYHQFVHQGHFSFRKWVGDYCDSHWWLQYLRQVPELPVHISWYSEKAWACVQNGITQRGRLADGDMTTSPSGRVVMSPYANPRVV